MPGITSLGLGLLPLVAAMPGNPLPGAISDIPLPDAIPDTPLPGDYPEVPSIPYGYNRVVFSDVFSAPALDPAVWTVDMGTSYPGGAENWGTGEVQTYTSSPANLFVADDHLNIVPHNDSGHWTSARIETAAPHDFACPEGGALLVEARIKLGNAAPETQAGVWPAFWLLGAAFRGNYTNWPSIGEVDILESPNGAQRNWNTAHCGIVEGGPCNEPEGLGGDAPVLRGDWRRFAVEIVRSEPQRLTWLVDGWPTFQLTPAQVGDPEAWRVLVADPKMILLNVAVGGALPDAIAERPTPDAASVGGEEAAMQVDYVAVYST